MRSWHCELLTYTNAVVGATQHLRSGQVLGRPYHPYPWVISTAEQPSPGQLRGVSGGFTQPVLRAHPHKDEDPDQNETGRGGKNGKNG